MKEEEKNDVTENKINNWDQTLHLLKHLLNDSSPFTTKMAPNNSSPYFCDVFSFLKSVIPMRAQHVEGNQVSTIPLVITCFDVCREYIFFGSNIGLVYGFHRGVEITSNPHIKLILTNKSIISIKFATFLSNATSPSTSHQPPNTVIVATEKQLLIYSLLQNKLLQEEIILQEDSGNITTLSSYDGIIACGTSHGEVYIIRTTVTTSGGFLLKKQMIFREDAISPEGSSNHRFHSIVQIEFHPEEYSLLISSCFRTIVVQIPESSSSLEKEMSQAIQVGQNKRKACGSYGAILMEWSKCKADNRTDSLSTSSSPISNGLPYTCIFAARPSSHLVRADPKTGRAQETFILKKSQRPLPKEAFISLKTSSRRVSNSSIATSTSLPLHLGKLIQLTDSMICSWTSNSLIIASITGALLLEENDLINIIGVAKVNQNTKKDRKTSQDFEIFVLFENRVIVRLRNFNLSSPSMTSLRQKSSSSILMSSSETDAAFFIPNPFNSIPLLNNLVSTLQSSNVINIVNISSNKDVLNNMSQSEDIEKSIFTENSFRKPTIPFTVGIEDEDTPVVVRSRRNPKSKGLHRPLSKRQQSQVSMVRSADSNNSICSPLVTSRTSIFSGGASSSISGGSSSDRVGESPEDENSKLSRILHLYKNEIVKDEPVMVTEVDSAVPLSKDSTLMTNKNNEEPPSKPGVDSNIMPEEQKPSCNVESEISLNLDQTSYFNNGSNLFNMNDNHPNKYDFYERTAEINMGPVKEMKWCLKISKAENSNLEKVPFDADNIIAVSSFNDDMRDGVGLLVQESKDISVYIYPGYKKLRCPYVNGGEKIRSFDINSRQILLLYEDGSLFRCVDWNKRSRNFITTLLPLKFTKISVSRIQRPLSLSINCMDQLCWTCDEDGLGWIIKIKNSLSTKISTPSCLLARDDSFPPVRLTSVTVSPRNSAIVWATDSCGRLFVREGVFNEKGDEDNLIAGINWIRVCDIPFSVKTAIASNDSVWILCDFSSGDRLFERKGIDPPHDYIGSHWQEYQLPASTSFMCLSGMSFHRLLSSLTN